MQRTSSRWAWRTIALGLFLGAVACGGGDATPITPTNPTPNPPPAPVATSLVISRGDAQQAEPGSALTVPPTVQVRDASGAAMAGVVVTFRVDSGGGAVQSASATTGADGTASSGVWTLGSAPGANVVVASTGTLSPVRFRALGVLPPIRTLVDSQLVAPSGGQLRYARQGDALNGLVLTIPNRAYPTATTWSIRADSSVAVPLPSGFSAVGPVLIVSNNAGQADSNLTLTVPMKVAASEAVAPFYFDAASGILEPIPLIERTDSSATLATLHFASSLLALPRNAPTASPLRGSAVGARAAAVAFGSVSIVWVRIPRAQLSGTFMSSFTPGVDSWEYVNLGEYIAPDGICEGMSITAIYYHYFLRGAGQPPLYHRYDRSVANQWDNLQGLRFAGSVQGDYEARFSAGIDQVQRLVSQGLARGTNVEDLTSTWLLLTLKLTQRPVLVGLQGQVGGHAVVAFGASAAGAQSTVFFADPNFPTRVRTASFTSGVLSPVSLQLNAGTAAAAFDKMYALGVTTEVPLSALHQRWTEFAQQKAGADRYPATYRFEVYNALTDTWGPLGDTVRTTDADLSVRFICPSCTRKTTGGARDEQPVNLWDATGASRVAGKLLTNTVGTAAYLAVGSAYTHVDATNTPGFVDSKPFTVMYRPFGITAPQSTAPPGVDLDFIALPAGLGGALPRFRWDFGDGTAPVNMVGDSTISHRWSTMGNFTVKVELRDGSGALVARATWGVLISNAASFAWEFSQATQLNATLPAGGIGSLKSDTVIFRRASAWIADLVANPHNHGLLLVGRANGGAKCQAVALLHQFGAAGPVDTIASATDLYGVLGACNDPDYTGNLTMTSPAQGTLNGFAAPKPNPNVLVLPGGSITATTSLNGALPELNGTFTVNVRYSTGIATYTVRFSAWLYKPENLP